MWSVSEEKLFGPGFSTNGGWAFRYDDQRAMFIGSVGSDPGSGPPVVGKHEALASRTTTVAFTEAGRSLWRRPGLALFSVPEFVADATPMSQMPLIAVEHTGGTVVFRGPDRKPRATAKDVSIAVVRLDPATGRNLWRVDLGDQGPVT